MNDIGYIGTEIYTVEFYHFFFGHSFDSTNNVQNATFYLSEWVKIQSINR